MIKRYNGFTVQKLLMELFSTLEDNGVYTSSDFLAKLKNLSNQSNNVGEISSAIISLIEDEVWLDDKYVRQNYLDITDKDDMISFLQSSKIPRGWDVDDDTSLPYTLPSRNEVKIGKIVRLLCTSEEVVDMLSFKPTDKDFEEFVNAYKASKIDKSKEFKLVNGEDIHKYYQMNNYYTSQGTLGGSCMADEGKSTFRVYTENPKKVQLLVLIDSNDKIHGRALVWKLKESPCEAKYFMDRVYTNSDSDVIKFKNFAEEKGFLYKLKNNSHVDNNIEFMYKGKSILGEIKVKLDGDFKNYPFIDTMCFLSKKLGDLSNIPSKGCYFLHSVRGDCDVCNVCDGDVLIRLHRLDAEFCNNCGLGLEELERVGIKTKSAEKLRED
jgi:hypothetical protein